MTFAFEGKMYPSYILKGLKCFKLFIKFDSKCIKKRRHGEFNFTLTQMRNA